MLELPYHGTQFLTPLQTERLRIELLVGETHRLILTCIQLQSVNQRAVITPDPSQFWWRVKVKAFRTLVTDKGKEEGKHRQKRLWILIYLELLVILLSRHGPLFKRLGQIAVS